MDVAENRPWPLSLGRSSLLLARIIRWRAGLTPTEKGGPVAGPALLDF
jgi:hypothetical protein